MSMDLSEPNGLHVDRTPLPKKEFLVPTDLNTAYENIDKFLGIENKLPQALRNRLGSPTVPASAPRIFTTIIGVCPEVFNLGLGYFKLNEIEEIENVINSQSDSFLVVRRPNSQPTSVSFFNVTSAHNVINNASEYFPPQAIENTRDWLSKSPSEEWNESDISDPSKDVYAIRYGVLSGFPLYDAIRYAPFQRLETKILNSQHTPSAREEMKHYIDAWILRSKSYNPKFPPNKAWGFITKNVDLTEEETQLLEAAESQGFPMMNILGFLGFSSEDHQYLDQVREIYNKAYERYVDSSLTG